MQFSIAKFLAQEDIQEEILKGLNRDFQINAFLERPIEFDRNQIRLEFLGNEEIEYDLMKSLNLYFVHQDIDIMEYSLNVKLTEKDENWITNMEITFIEALN